MADNRGINYKRVVFTTHTYSPYSDGVSVVNHYLATGLSKKGYKVEVITYKSELLKETELCENVLVHRVVEKNRLDKYVEYIKNNVKSDDVLINVCIQTPTTDLLLKELQSIKCYKKILYTHGTYSFRWNSSDWSNLRSIVAKIYHNIIWGKYFLDNKKYFKKYDAITQLHANDEGNVIFERILGLKTCIIENAADDDFFTENDNVEVLGKYDLSCGYLLCVNNFDARKNQEMLIRSYYMSNTQKDLVLIGSEENEYVEKLRNLDEQLQQKAIEKGDRKRVIILANKVPRSSISAIVKNAGIYLLGSTFEMFPVSVIEAMAAGIPFVATDVGVVKYLPGGLVVKVNDKRAMAREIDRLSTDEKLYNKLSCEGVNYARMRMQISDKVNDLEKMFIE
ncbi:glycosyltransferase family 4 protein [Butyrivibrio sp. AE2015]|uniref:glycosyltransferase family 4 protein n=1 Tax=Butyrivibrio sp. AE2015 TaxID=1280663 RepID=UPI0003B7477B|nr:glycosyltransferase family 4 protein [Butyrivibrio sp. AE2015]